MPDYPYIYAANSPLRVTPGGTRTRFFRRRHPAEGEEETPGPERSAEEARWFELLSAAVAELNEALQRSRAPFACTFEEDERGLSLRVFHLAEDGSPVSSGESPEEIDVSLDPADLPVWLARLRSHLGVVVDERA